MIVPNTGPRNARVMIVGEAPGSKEAYLGKPFVGGSGKLLADELQKHGLPRESVFFANVVKQKPAKDIGELFLTKTEAKKRKNPITMLGKYVTGELVTGIRELERDIREVEPDIIFCLGNVALWAVTGEYNVRSTSAAPTGIAQWRGSHMKDRFGLGIKVMPTYNPAMVLKQYETLWIFQKDINRGMRWWRGAIKKFDVTINAAPEYHQVVAFLGAVLNDTVTVACDIETYKGIITCIGFARGQNSICIPFCDAEGESYWSVDEETNLLWYMQRVFEKCPIIGQNFMYDSQYIAKLWGIKVVARWDTMHMQHIIAPGTPKRLDFLGSIWCNWYEYWKDEGKEWDPKLHDMGRLWEYNCKDCLVTYEVAMRQMEYLEEKDIMQQYSEFQQQTWPVLQMQMRGVRIDEWERGRLREMLAADMGKDTEWFSHVIPRGDSKKAPWWSSPTQQMQLFYKDLRQGTVKKMGRPTVDDNALQTIGEREPLLRPLTDRMQSFRTKQTLYKNFLSAKLDKGRMHSSIRIDGTETMRYSSSQSVFGTGGNLQNVTKTSPAGNLRKCLIPDPGYRLFECDLKQADAQVVAWEAGDQVLMDGFLGGRYNDSFDLHSRNAEVIGCSRQEAKAAVHAINYGTTAATLAKVIGGHRWDAQDVIDKWLSSHPQIRRWHEGVRKELYSSRTIVNKFGYGITYLGRVEQQFKEALAWVPQSTVALIVSKALVRLGKLDPDVKLMIHGHDSIVFQVRRIALKPALMQNVFNALQITVPYDIPLCIPWDISWSDKSWGDVKEGTWDNYGVTVL